MAGGLQRAQRGHAISVLLGKAPAQFALPDEVVATVFPDIPPGLPSELLERRPDIAAAERRAAYESALQHAYAETLTRLSRAVAFHGTATGSHLDRVGA